MRKMVYSIILVWMSTLLFPVFSFAQIKIEISSIGQKDVNSEEIISVKPIENISGKVVFNLDEKKIPGVLVEVAIRFEKDNAWELQEETTRLQKNREYFNWEIGKIQFGKDSDYGKGFEIVAAVVSKDNPIRAGIIDYDTLQRCSIALSNRISVVRTTTNDTGPTPYVSNGNSHNNNGSSPLSKDDSTPLPRNIVSIRIDYIGKESVLEHSSKSREFIPAGLCEVLCGEVIKPEDTFIQIVVQPMEGGSRWIMDEPGIAEDRTWHGTGYFGREGNIDIGKKFLVYAIITKELFRGGQVDIKTWEVYKRKHILALSPAVKVIRVGEVRIVINRIGSKDVNDKMEYTVCKNSGIEGIIEYPPGYPIPSRENRDRIWLFITPSNGTGTWKPIRGREAIFPHPQGYHWVVPPTHLGKAGQRLIIVAVASQIRIRNLNNAEERTHIIAISREVYIQTQDYVELNHIEER